MDLLTLPKIELHLHLDCSLSYEVVNKIDPSISLETYKRSFVGPAKCHDLNDYLKRAKGAIQLMQSKEELEWVTDDVFRQLVKDNVIYAEIRFAPLEHIKKGLKVYEVVHIINEAAKRNFLSTGIEGGIILCTLRNYSEEQSLETVKLVKSFQNTRIVGFDIAADEAGFPIDNHVAAFTFAKKEGISCTAHAGEACGPKSVWETLNNFFPSRIGHGVRSMEDSRLVNFLKQEDIHLEICPTSNIQINIYDTMKDHPVDQLYNEGVSLSINTDARTISNVTLTDEYKSLNKTFHWKKKELLACNLYAIEAAFTSRQVKENIKTILAKSYSVPE